METLDVHLGDHGVDSDQLRPFLRDRFPWHQPEIAQPELCDPNAWWQHIETLITNAFVGVGIEQEKARELSRLARHRFIDSSCRWRLFDDTLAVLQRLTAAGWSHAILSNHIPELPDLVAGLGLGRTARLPSSAARPTSTKPRRSSPNNRHQVRYV